MSGRRFLSLRAGRHPHPVATHVPLAALLEGQFESGGFRRLDLALRARMARALLDTGDVPEDLDDLYRRMQDARAGKDTRAAFRQVVESVRANGLDPAYPVGMSPQGPLLDGAHRTALALVLNVPTLAVDIRPSRIPASYGREWFLAHGFREEVVREWEGELDGFLRATGHDTCVVIAGTVPSSDELQVLVGSAGHVREVRVATSTDVDVPQLQRVLTAIPFHGSPPQEHTPDSLDGERVTIARVRFAKRTWDPIVKTHTAILREARTLRDVLRQAGHTAIVGSTIAQNRNVWALLDQPEGMVPPR